MPEPSPARRYRFGVFEADAAVGELRRQGVRVKLNAQPFQVLCMLLDRPGELLTREQISRELWPDGTFVDYEHGVNSAVNRIREALGDTAGSPRFVETLARRGYRFVAPVERIGEIPPSATSAPPQTSTHQIAAQPATAEQTATQQTAQPMEAQQSAPPALSEVPVPLFGRVLASPEELPKTSHTIVQTLFVLLQLMYLAFYVGALANLPEIEDLLAPLSHAMQVFMLLVVTAGIMIPVRVFVISLVVFHAPRAREKFLSLWPLLLLLDLLWSLAPFLLLHHMDFGLALACTAPLVYSPFAQRSLILMGAGRPSREVSAA